VTAEKPLKQNKMNIITLCTKGIAGNAKAKRARRGMEKNWNRFSEPLKRFLCGKFSKTGWVEHKRKLEKYIP
jgi:hypothetical protein